MSVGLGRSSREDTPGGVLWPESPPPAEKTEPIAPVPAPRAHRGDEKKRSAACHNCGKEGHFKAQCPVKGKSARGGNHLQEALKDESARADGNAIAAREFSNDLKELRAELDAARGKVADREKQASDSAERVTKLEKEICERNAVATAHARAHVESLDVLIGKRALNETLLVIAAIVHLALTAWAITGTGLYYPAQREETSYVFWTNMDTKVVPYWQEVPVGAIWHSLVLLASAVMFLWWIVLYLDRHGHMRILPQYRVRFSRWADRGEYPDLRADVNSLQALKHKNPLYCWVSYSSLTSCGEALISAELLAQLSATKYMDPLMDYDTAKFKIVNAVSTTQLVNLDRYAAFAGSSVGLDTAVVALAMWRQFKDQFEEKGFGLRPC